MKTVDAQSLSMLRALTQRRDSHARVLGMAFIEKEIATAKAIAERAPDVATRVGTASMEFESFRQRYMAKVAADCKLQEEVGKKALRAAGFDPDGRITYTIELASGAIKVLRNGAWEDVP